MVALILLCLYFGWPRFRSGIGLGDEGFLAYGAVRVMQGQLPQLDFVSLQPPLAFYTVALVFKVFGTSLVALRSFGLAIYLLLPLLTYAVARNMAGWGLSLTAAVPVTLLGLPYFEFVPFAVWQGIAATAMAVLLCLRAARSGSSVWLGFPAGIMTAASLLARQDQGLYLVVSIVVYTWALKCRRVFFWWSVGILAGLCPWFIYWFDKRALAEMFKQLIAFPITTYAKTSSLPFPNVTNITFILYYLPPLLCLIVACWLWKQWRRGRFQLREANLLFMLVWTSLYYCQVLTRSDLFHLLITLLPFFILCSWGWVVVLETSSATAGKSRKVLSALGVAMAAWFLWSTGPIFLHDRQPSETMALPRAGVHVQGGIAFADFIRQIQSLAPPGRSILCLPYQPMLYFLCERRNPTRWNYIWPGDQSARDYGTLIEQARRDPPVVVLLTGEADVNRYAPAIVEYVRTGFRFVGRHSGISVYLAK